jgi:hypothetical protein
MAHAWVAEMDAGEFVSHVEIDGDHPFTVINGPSGDWDTVMGWARTVASEVTVRIGERVFSAGSASSVLLPAAPPESADAPPAGRHADSDRADFEVRAALAWMAGDARAVGRGLARALAVDEVRFEQTTGGFAISFAVRGHDEFDAGWTASHALGTAWNRAGLKGRAGVDYDLVQLDCRRLNA